MNIQMPDIKTDIRYWRMENNLEVILCQNSSISYPLHNHVSTYTIGLLLNGEIELQTGAANLIYRPNSFFIIPPYLPHQITAKRPYTMLTICLPAGNQPTFGALDFIKKQLEQQPQLSFSLDEMARTVHLSKYHFLRCFKQAFGLTPHQFQLQNRVRQAQRLLPTAQNLTEVALDIGFCDQSHFIRNFEKHLGLTPTAYKAACQSLPRQAPA